jgi:hypothetical protein
LLISQAGGGTKFQPVPSCSKPFRPVKGVWPPPGGRGRDVGDEVTSLCSMQRQARAGKGRQSQARVNAKGDTQDPPPWMPRWARRRESHGTSAPIYGIGNQANIRSDKPVTDRMTGPIKVN